METKVFGYITYNPKVPIAAEVQKHRISRYALFSNLNISKFYVDSTVDTKKTELERLLFDVKQENAEVMLVINSLGQFSSVIKEQVRLLNDVMQHVKKVEIIDRSAIYKLVASKLFQLNM